MAPFPSLRAVAACRVVGFAVLCALVALPRPLHAQPSEPRASAASSPPISIASGALAELGAVARAGARPDALVAGYALLRELAGAWDEDDPDAIEAALAAAAADASLQPQLRSYASLLAGHARRRRGDLVGAVERVRDAGFATSFLVVGPFDNESRAGLAARALPELELAEPVVLDRAFEGKVRPVHWRALPPTGVAGPASFGWLDLGALVDPRTFVCVFASTFVESAAESARPATLWVGAAGAFEAFFEDKLVLSDREYRELDADRLAVTVSLPPGYTRITLKACGDAAGPMLSLRVGDAAGGVLDGISFEASVAASTHAAAALRRRRESAGDTPRPPNPTPHPAPPPRAPGPPAARPGAEVLGPVQLCAPALAPAPTAARAPVTEVDPALADACARYVLATHGQVGGSHAAHDMARRVAERAPSFERALRAARLASERNEASHWIERAAPLAASAADNARLASARAELARLGASVLDATPLYELALRLEPDNVVAAVGKVQLYAEAGLHRSALGLLDAALGLRPSAAALLQLQGRELRALGRDRDAAEVESRFAALHFDDAAFIEQQIGLAVARRDCALVRHFTDRLVAVQPASVWALAVSARALRACGDASGARARYATALELAPDDASVLAALAELAGELGVREEQAALLRRVVELAPQDQAARAHLEHVEPSAAPDDERYAWNADQLLALRTAPGPAPDGESVKRVLRRLAVTTLFDNGLARRFYQVAYEPLTTDAAAQARQFSFFYHSDRQIVTLRAARIYRANGRVDESVETGSLASDDPSMAMYSLQRAFYVLFPRVEPGDVVEVSYRIDDLAGPSELADNFGEVEPLQGEAPIASVEYVLSSPAARRLFVSVTPLPGLEREERNEAGRHVLRVRARDVPALRAEPHMPPASELLAQVHASSFASWRDVGTWYAAFSRDMLLADEEVRRRAHEVVGDASELAAKVAAVYRFAANEMRYVALEFGIEGIRPRPAALTLARGWGDCKDKAALIVSMLRELGIDAEMVLVRSGLRGGFDTSIASLAPFDHAIAYVPALDLYLDGTAELHGMTELPQFDRNAWALRITPEGGKLVRLPEPGAGATVEEKRVTISPHPGGALDFEAELTMNGAAAAGGRERFAPDATRRERARDELGMLGAVVLAEGKAGLEFDDLTNFERPVHFKAHGRSSAHADRDGFAVPLGPGFRLTAELAGLAARRAPLMVGVARTVREVWELRLPAGAKLVSPPLPLVIDAPMARYEVSVSNAPATSGERVTAVTTTLRLPGRIEPSDYPAWRRFCEAVDAALAARAVIGW